LNKECKDCGAEIKVPNDSVVGEIVTCPDVKIVVQKSRFQRIL